MTLAIVPGAIIDRLFFNHKLNARQWVGILVAIAAGYFVLGFPSFQRLITLPLWIWLSLIGTITVAINQGITQKIKAIDPFVKNFWGGLTTFLLCFVCVLFFNPSLSNFIHLLQKLFAISAITGLITVALWYFNLMSYKSGAYIALKKLVMNGCFLTMSMVLGVVVFSEIFSLPKAGGIALYFAAFILLDQNAWQFFSKKLKTAR